jgi:uncharacterized RDD family membrane protein YckC
MTQPPDPDDHPPQPGGPRPIPSLTRRLGARLLDGLLLGVVWLLLGLLVFGATTEAGSDAGGDVTSGGGLVAAYAGWAFLGLLLTLLYEGGLVATRGATLGKRLLRVKVVRTADGTVPGWGPSLLRWLVPTAGWLTCGLGTLLVYLSPAFDGTGCRRGWHDKAAGTQVVGT